jgi:hypothetical protein
MATAREHPSDRELLLHTLGPLAHLTHRAGQIARSITTSDISEIRQIGKDFMLLRRHDRHVAKECAGVNRRTFCEP